MRRKVSQLFDWLDSWLFDGLGYLDGELVGVFVRLTGEWVGSLLNGSTGGLVGL